MTEERPNGLVERLIVRPDARLREVLPKLGGAVDEGLPAGIALVVGDRGELTGTVTDGDIRRTLLAGGSVEDRVGTVMRRDPITFREGTSFRDILRLLPGELRSRGRHSRRFLGKIILVDDAGRPTRVLDYHQLWEQRVATHRHVVVVGMGYVGLTLALVLAEEGFHVTGLEIDGGKIEDLRAGVTPLHEVGLVQLLREQLDGNFVVARELPADGDLYVIAVGTPVGGRGADALPSLVALEHAAEMVSRRLVPGGLVVVRSTVPVGTTREVVLPILERGSGLRAGTDFHLAFAPERTAEGVALQELRELPQLIGGVNDDSVEATAALFRELTPTIVRMESLEAAELAKLVNNAFRDLIFAFSNEVAQIAAPFNFDVVEAIRSANRGYPRDPVPLPSPGVGGPCLTKDPYLLASSAARAGLGSTLVQHGRRVNERMPAIVAEAVLKHLEGVGKTAADCSVLLCGLAFKGRPETDDLRQSTALEVARLLSGRVGRLLGHDPVVTDARIAEAGLEPVLLQDGLAVSDAALFLNNHPFYESLDGFELIRALRPPPVVFDGWRLFRPDDLLRACPAVYVGVGFARSSVSTSVDGG